jgi:MFS family permease
LALVLQVTFIAGVCMLTSAIARVNFAAAAPLLATNISLNITQLSHLHSAFLFGYLVGHIPFGILADRYGGTRTLSAAAVAWALITAAHGASSLLAAAANVPVLDILLVLRFAIGAATAAAVPGLAAMLAQELPAELRAGAMSAAYGMPFCLSLPAEFMGVDSLPCLHMAIMRNALPNHRKAAWAALSSVLGQPNHIPFASVVA